ncbi:MULTISPECIES: sigma-70 family RNA polymerase sigma factor [Corallococcus]|uniref:sigma-70 family RNA polymerase sigma factor n=1 Tax=Corallococcus TaxID=83461 RepID=UPI00117E926F|nr:MULTISPECIES: sigma-70 family RNA polymerase sigma factor [Corallococcus]NBD11893.1 sigma-70 family RNA polymerase sigma factor [Corallococcus silvisoli]TSC23523.1 sigma-70 family RNA polymerase sigma factor [Corallococcus sp. Z5C101001]
MAQVPAGLAANLLAHTKTRFVPPSPEDLAALDALLLRAWEDARARWPGVELPATRFVSHLAEHLPAASPTSPVAPLVEGLSLQELYLACACLLGLASAHEAFERHYLSRLPERLRSLKQSDAVIDEVRQRVRVKLLVAAAGTTPSIGDYTGRGGLMSWVVVIAGRIANKLRAQEKPAPDDDAEELFKVLPGQGLDPELDVMKRRHHAAFLQAVREAAATLSDEDRHLLRLHFADRLSTYEMAPLFRVNQSTISRWLKRAQQQVHDETRRRLQEQLGLTTEGFQSFLAFVDSQLDLTLSQLLGEKREPPPPEG